MNLLKKIDHYLLTNHPILWRTKVHYFVLFSLILGNIAAMFASKLIGEGEILVFGRVSLGLITLFWLISQAQNKIKHYRFWDEVLTFGVYMLCASMLYINFIMLTEIQLWGQGYNNNTEVLLLGGSIFVFISATTVYLIAHTGIGNILGIVLLHFLGAPLIIFISGNPITYVILFVFMFILLCSISENDRITRFIRFLLIPYIPLEHV